MSAGPDRQRWRHWLLYISLASVLHVLLGGGFLLGLIKMFDPPAPAPDGALVVVQLMPAPAAHALQASPPPSPPLAAAPQEKSAITEATAVVMSRPSLEAVSPDGERAAPHPEQAAPKDTLPAPATDTVPQATPENASQLGAESGLTLTAQEQWEWLVLEHLNKHKRYPPAALLARQQDRVVLRLRVDRNGNIVEAAIASSRKNPLLDREALELTRRASPLPPPPAEVPDADLDFQVPVEFEID